MRLWFELVLREGYIEEVTFEQRSERFGESEQKYLEGKTFQVE